MSEIHLHLDKSGNRFLVLDKTIPKVIVTENKKYVLTIQQQGVQGASSDIQTVTLGEAVSRGNILYTKQGKFYRAGNQDTFILNNPIVSFVFANTDGVANSQIEVRRFGTMILPSAGFTPDQTYYLGVGGGITVTPPTQGLLLIVGQAISAQDLLIEWGTPILVGG
jgi:hypothetical protein